MWEFNLYIPIPNWTGFCLGSVISTMLFATWAIWLAKKARSKNAS